MLLVQRTNWNSSPQVLCLCVCHIYRMQRLEHITWQVAWCQLDCDKLLCIYWLKQDFVTETSRSNSNRFGFVWFIATKKFSHRDKDFQKTFSSTCTVICCCNLLLFTRSSWLPECVAATCHLLCSSPSWIWLKTRAKQVKKHGLD